MAQFLRGKQAGIQHDLSAGLNPELFDLDYVSTIEEESCLYVITTLRSLAMVSILRLALWPMIPFSRYLLLVRTSPGLAVGRSMSLDRNVFALS